LVFVPNNICVDNDVQNLANDVVRTLRGSAITVVTAESCTAGLLAALLSKPKGAGDVLEGGFVCYSKQQKVVALGVSGRLLQEKGAVNAEVAAAMATGALEHSTADIALAVTGVLGPEPDEDRNPVGLVYLCRQRRNQSPEIHKFEFGKLPHEQICSKTLKASLKLLGD
jgi:nicotinamide-nucleotide amidase